MTKKRVFYSAKIEKASIQPDELYGNEIPHPYSNDKGDLISYWNNLQSIQSYHSRCLDLRTTCAVELGLNFTNAVPDERLMFVNDDNESLQEVMRRVAIDYMHGNGYLELVKGKGSGNVEGIYFMPSVEVWRRPRGSSTAFLYRSTNEGTAQYIPRFPDFNQDGRSILHFQRTTNLNRHYGYPSWLGIIPEIELDRYTTLYNQKFFINSGVPDLVIIVEGGDLTEGAEEAITEYLSNNFKGVDNSQRTLVIPVDGSDVKVKFERIGMTMEKDGSFTKLRESCRDRIISGWGCPSRLVGVMSAGSLGGGGEVASQLKTFQETVNGPDQRYIASKLSPVFKAMGLPDFIGFNPIDTDNYEETVSLFGAGVINKNEARSLHGYEEVEDGEEFSSSNKDKNQVEQLKEIRKSL